MQGWSQLRSLSAHGWILQPRRLGAKNHQEDATCAMKKASYIVIIIGIIINHYRDPYFQPFWNFRCSQLLSWREVRSGGVVKPVAKPKGLDPELKGWKKSWPPNSCWLKRSRFLNSTGPVVFLIFIFRLAVFWWSFFFLHFLLAIFPVLEK